MGDRQADRQQGDSERTTEGLTRGEGCCGSDEANRCWMGALNALAGNESRARRLAIDSNALELILIYVKDLRRGHSVSGTRSTGASG